MHSSRDLADPYSRFRQKRVGGMTACERSAEREVIICTFRGRLFEEKLLCRCSRMPSRSDWAQRLRVDQSASEHSSQPRWVLINKCSHRATAFYNDCFLVNKTPFVRLPASLVGHEPDMYALSRGPSFTRGKLLYTDGVSLQGGVFSFMSPFRYLTSAPQAGCISRYLTRDRDGVYGNEGKVRFVSNRTLEPMTEYTSEVTLWTGPHF